MRELTALVKLFHNVNINTAWIDILSPKATKEYLSEWITSLPYNKIFGFGGDQFSILLTCAYAEMVRDNLSKILTYEVSEGNIEEKQVLDIAEHLLRKNALGYFKLKK
jgi:hypothetical protein